MTDSLTLDSRSILGMRADAISYPTVNNVMEGYDSPAFRSVMNRADLVAPDGMPLVWGLRALGIRGATRVYGPDLTPHVLAAAEREGIPVGFYGATGAVLERLLKRIHGRYPRLDVAYALAPPFRPLSDEEDIAVTERINASGARILFVGLSTPKQERWMAAHRGRVGAVMLGVGAAFDFLAGVKRQAPRWMMGAGLEWLFRLASEPRRLWRRYLKHNPRFVFLFLGQLLGWRRFR
jgi:N-acetylglucosaminyldiphosphoundecaprenol N-acetyl-beta-D-mannosaminyltransferase